MKVDDRFVLPIFIFILHVLNLSWAKPFNKSLICGGADNKHRDPTLGHYNTSGGEFHCFFKSPNNTGVLPDPNVSHQNASISAARAHCARYSAGLPVIPDPKMFWAVFKMVTKRLQREEVVIVPMGIKNATHVHAENTMYVTWDNGQTNIYNLSEWNGTHGWRPYDPMESQIKCCFWKELEGAKYDTPVLLHVYAGHFRPNPMADGSLFLLCHQNVTKLLAEGDGDDDIGSTTEPSPFSVASETETTRRISVIPEPSVSYDSETETVPKSASGSDTTRSFATLFLWFMMMWSADV